MFLFSYLVLLLFVFWFMLPNTGKCAGVVFIFCFSCIEYADTI